MVSAPAETKGGESVTTLLNEEVAGALGRAAAAATPDFSPVRFT